LKVLLLSLSLLLVFLPTANALIEPEQAPDYYSFEYQAILASQSDSLVSPKSLRGYSFKFLDVPVYSQQLTNWCGPASTKMAIHGVNGSSPSQSVLAKETNADPKGSYVYLIERSLNKYIAGEPYKYYIIKDVNLVNKSVQSFQNGLPVIYRLKTKNLPGYWAHDTTHYVVGTGYFVAWDETGTIRNDVWYNDPNDYRAGCLGEHTIPFSTLDNAVRRAGDGWFIPEK